MEIKSQRFRMNGTEFHKGARNTLISFIGMFLGWLAYAKLGITVTPETSAMLETGSSLLGGAALHYLNYFFNGWRI